MTLTWSLFWWSVSIAFYLGGSVCMALASRSQGLGNAALGGAFWWIYALMNGSAG